MYALANCTASILRGSEEDEFGQQVDSNTVVTTGILAQITEQGRTVQDTNSLTPRTVRLVKGIVPSATNIRQGDQLRDDVNNRTYRVVEVIRPGNLGITRDLELQLQQID
jgi:hypothetical protein